MAPQVAGGVDDDGNSVEASDVVPSLVLETDDIVSCGIEQEGEAQEEEQLEQEQQPSPSSKKSRSPRPSHLLQRLSWASFSDARPSVANIVATEVATFYDVFGVLGVPMIILFCVSAAWTFMLAAIQIHADSMANKIMKTTEFDNGEFWLLPKADTDIIISAVILLSLFGTGYTALAVTMVFFHHTGEPKHKDSTQGERASKSSRMLRILQPVIPKNGFVMNVFQRGMRWYQGLPSDVCEHYFTAALDLPKLIFQSMTMYTYLRKGFPTPIIYYYSVLLLCNWLVTSYRSQHYVVDPNLIITRLYYTFDLFFAVFAPLVVLIYYIYTFKFDREEFLTRTETLSPGIFDVVARIFAEPSQISSFCSAFHYLQFSSGTSLFYKSALNFLSLYKWRKIVMTLIHNHQERQLERKRRALVEPTQPKLSRPGMIKAVITRTLSSTPKMGKHVRAKLFLSLVFFAAGVHNFVYSIGSVQSTTALCSKYDQCALYSYYWNFGEKDCTCLVFADRETSPTTFAEWTNPKDITSNLAELSMAGELRIIQIINRAVPELPEELRRCYKVEQLILAYTKTVHIPEWVSEFTSLEYFHIEGDFTSRRLLSIADGVFDDMHHLAFLHVGTLPDVVELPSLSSLGKLRYLTLAVLDSLTEIPSFEGLTALSDLNLINLPSVKALPSLAPLTSIKSIVIRARSAVCCNGFITGTCNMTESQCLPIVGEHHPLSCTDARISAEDKAELALFGPKICPASIPIDRELTAPSKYSTDELCGGVKYKQCTLNGFEGMCYNTRMMVINCETTASYITMRKLQIQRGVGDACDPDVEAWLGCSST